MYPTGRGVDRQIDGDIRDADETEGGEVFVIDRRTGDLQNK